MMGVISLPPPAIAIYDGGIGLIERTEPSDTLNYKSCFKHCILQTILQVFFLLIFL